MNIGGWGKRQPAGLWSLAVSVRVRVPQRFASPTTRKDAVPDSREPRPSTIIVLAAGEGTRMKSRTPKVLHGFAGRSMLGHVLAAAETVRAQRTIVVVGHQRDVVTEHLVEIAPGAEPVVQE